MTVFFLSSVKLGCLAVIASIANNQLGCVANAVVCFVTTCVS